MKEGFTLPQVTFPTRVRNDELGGDNPFEWRQVSSSFLFGGKEQILKKRCIVFSLPGAFTPTCSTYQLPDFEKMAADGDFHAYGIEDIYCVSVNDTFVMNCWARDQKLEHVKVVPDGTGEFTRKMGMLVDKSNIGFGMRSWRYAMIVKDGVIEKWFEEPGREDNHPEDPYGETSPENVMHYLNTKRNLDY